MRVLRVSRSAIVVVERPVLAHSRVYTVLSSWVMKSPNSVIDNSCIG